MRRLPVPCLEQPVGIGVAQPRRTVGGNPPSPGGGDLALQQPPRLGVLTEIGAGPGFDDPQLDPGRGIQVGLRALAGELQRLLGAAEGTFAVGQHREVFVVPAHPAQRPIFAEGRGVILGGVGGLGDRGAHHRQPGGQPASDLGVGVRQFRVLIDQQPGGEQSRTYLVGEIGRQTPQLGLHPARELTQIEILGEVGFVLRRTDQTAGDPIILGSFGARALAESVRAISTASEVPVALRPATLPSVTPVIPTPVVLTPIVPATIISTPVISTAVISTAIIPAAVISTAIIRPAVISTPIVPATIITTPIVLATLPARATRTPASVRAVLPAVYATAAGGPAITVAARSTTTGPPILRPTGPPSAASGPVAAAAGSTAFIFCHLPILPERPAVCKASGDAKTPLGGSRMSHPEVLCCPATS